MAFSQGQVLQITHRMSFRSQLCANVYHYQVLNDNTLSAGAMAKSWWDDVKDTWRAWQILDSAFITLGIDLAEYGVQGAYATYTPPGSEQTGTRSNTGVEYLPTFCAVGVRLNVGTRVTRPGSKRYVGLVEGDTQGDGFLTSTAYGLIDAFAQDVLGSNESSSIADELGLVIVSTVDVTPPAFVFQAVTSAVVNSRVTSQVSRKFGRGS